MRQGVRLLLAVTLMMGVIVATNLLFPPVPPDPVPTPTGGVPADADAPPSGAAGEDEGPSGVPGGFQVPEGEGDERLVTVETPLFRVTLSNTGGAVRSVQLLGYESFASGGPVELVAPGADRVMSGLWLVGSRRDSVDLTGYAHRVSPADGLRLSPGDGPQTLTFRYDHPSGQFFSEIRYTFTADSYVVGVEGDLPAVERGGLFLDLGRGPAINELRERDDRVMMAFSGNRVGDGIRSVQMRGVDAIQNMEGPLYWAAVKSKYFVHVLLSQDDGQGFLSQVIAWPDEDPDRARVRVGIPVDRDGGYAYRAYMGPIERARLLEAGRDLEEVNPYGWRFLRPVIRPFVGAILWVIKGLHDNLNLGYGWVLMVVGVLMRVVLWPLNQKAMRSQTKTMALQPQLEEIKKRYANNPQKAQQETVRMYRESGVNPLAGCVPMLIPLPMLIALFFVFQNTIQLRGSSFMWLPDLSSPDPYYILPIFLGLSMFLLQFIMMRATKTANPQMKMMMYVMPVAMVFIFWRFASGLNLYYATANLATIPQQILIARERKKVQQKLPAAKVATSPEKPDGPEKPSSGPGHAANKARSKRRKASGRKTRARG